LRRCEVLETYTRKYEKGKDLWKTLPKMTSEKPMNMQESNS